MRQTTDARVSTNKTYYFLDITGKQNYEKFIKFCLKGDPRLVKVMKQNYPHKLSRYIKKNSRKKWKE